MAGILDVINSVSWPWAAGMWTALWQSTLLAGAVYLIGAGFRRIPPAVRFWLWMFVGLRLVAMPFITLEFPVIPAPQPAVAPAAAAPAAAPSIEFMPDMARADGAGAPAIAPGEGAAPPIAQAAGAIPVLPTTAAALSATSALMLLWCAGLALVLARLAWACLRTRRTIAAARYGDGRLDALAARAGSLFDMARPPRVGVTEEPVAPFVYGAWNPAVILPRRLVDGADDEQLLVVLAHEFAHVHRRDPLLGWAFALCHALYFFHPALPFVRRQLLLERERACDDWVLALSNARPSAYANVLLAVASMCSAPRISVPALVASESFQDLKKRLHALRYGAVSRPRISPAGAIALAALGLLAAPGIVFTQGAAEVQAAAPVTAALLDAADVQEVLAGPYLAETQPSPTLQLAADAPAANSEPSRETVKTRTLRFPSNRVVGTIRIQDADKAHFIDRYYYWNDEFYWTALGPAQGEVAVPDGKVVWLTLNEEAYSDLSFLRNLEPDAIYHLSTLYAEENDVCLDDAGMIQVAALTGLKYLDIRYAQVTDRGLERLAAFSNLERLSVPRATTDTGLAHVGKVASLEGLYINANRTTDNGLVHLEKLENLRELALGGGDISDAGLVHLEKLPKLEYLLLWGKRFGDAGMLHVSKIPNLNNLHIANQGVTNRGIQYLSNAPKLATLNLYGVEAITGLALKYLAEMKTLRRLNLSCPVGDDTNLTNHSMSYLAKCTSLEALDSPRVIDDSGLARLAKLPNLKHLDVWTGSNTAITDAGLMHIASMRNLESLQVGGGNGITDTGLIALSSLRNLESLHILSDSTAITGAGVAGLASLQKLKVLTLTLNRKAGVPLSVLTRLNALTALTSLKTYGFQQDDSTLDLSPMKQLEFVMMGIEGGFRDADLACFSGMPKLRWLQGIQGITDAGVAHLAGLTQLDRLNIGGEGVTDAAFEHLQGLRALDTLSVQGHFTDAGLRALYPLKGLHWLTIQSEESLSDAAQERLIAHLPNLTLYNSQALAGSAHGGGFGG